MNTQFLAHFPCLIGRNGIICHHSLYVSVCISLNFMITMMSVQHLTKTYQIQTGDERWTPAGSTLILQTCSIRFCTHHRLCVSPKVCDSSWFIITILCWMLHTEAHLIFMTFRDLVVLSLVIFIIKIYVLVYEGSSNVNRTPFFFFRAQTFPRKAKSLYW